MISDDESGFVPMICTAADGLKLYARDYGQDNPLAAERPPIICLPGLTRNSRDFHQLALLLSRDTISPRRVISLDARGRGLSAWDDDKSHYNLIIESEDVVSACNVLGISEAIFIGTSRGGLVLHVLATTHPELLRGVILNDIGPVLEIEGLKDIRDYLNRERKPQSWDDAIAILKEDHGKSFPALGEQDWRDMAYAIYAEIDGKVVADVDPAIGAIMKAIDLEAPQRDLWPQFEAFGAVPLMTIRGEMSKLLSAETLIEMGRRHPGMTALTVAGHGHPPILHLGATASAIQAFLAAT